MLAFLALRPGKGWLRRPVPPPFVYDRPAAPGSLGPVDTMLDSASLSCLDKSKGGHMRLGDGSGSDLEAGAEQRNVVGAASPHSLRSSQTGRWARMQLHSGPVGWHGPAEHTCGGPLNAGSFTQQRLIHRPCCSLASAGVGDPLLSFIASSLASRGPAQGAAGPGGLPAHMAEWVVPWDQITLDQPIGKGSFGWGESRGCLACWLREPPCRRGAVLAQRPRSWPRARSSAAPPASGPTPLPHPPVCSLHRPVEPDSRGCQAAPEYGCPGAWNCSGRRSLAGPGTTAHMTGGAWSFQDRPSCQAHEHAPCLSWECRGCAPWFVGAATAGHGAAAAGVPCRLFPRFALLLLKPCSQHCLLRPHSHCAATARGKLQGPSSHKP